ncbi:hypothetical protein ASG67_04045 [Sphingomonas sp. Leaf339]|uniref:hypothetical protein n=1 Tax=Sphingomonas sp. Leaf339 TaxID=1736343 RepID=UPI0007022A97|nr:hypothetical protein [Sphingomonas sp. Leaf339]KQU62279.1 hypothetical protein ASG67_04045 [Sphingomonas sp. Leaf339]
MPKRVRPSSTLTSAGGPVVLLNGSQIADFFSNTGSGPLSSAASVIHVDSTDNNVSGDLYSPEQGIIDANAIGSNDFLGAEGGLFSHSQGYGWLSTLVSGLTDADLSAGPYHNTFAGVGGISILGVGAAGTSLSGSAVIMGGAGGTITQPTVPVVSEPAS